MKTEAAIFDCTSIFSSRSKYGCHICLYSICRSYYLMIDLIILPDGISSEAFHSLIKEFLRFCFIAD